MSAGEKTHSPWAILPVGGQILLVGATEREAQDFAQFFEIFRRETEEIVQ